MTTSEFLARRCEELTLSRTDFRERLKSEENLDVSRQRAHLWFTIGSLEPEVLPAVCRALRLDRPRAIELYALRGIPLPESIAGESGTQAEAAS